MLQVWREEAEVLSGSLALVFGNDYLSDTSRTPKAVFVNAGMCEISCVECVEWALRCRYYTLQVCGGQFCKIFSSTQLKLADV